MIKSLTLLLLLCSFHFSSFAQVKGHLVYFTDKDNTPFSVNQPQEFLTDRAIARRQKQHISIKERDLPVNPTYVQELRNLGATVLYASKWLNAAIIKTDPVVLAEIENLSFVKGQQGLTYSDDAILEQTDKMGIAAFNQKQTSYFTPKVSSILKSNTLVNTQEDYGVSATQNEMIGIDKMHQEGYHGEGMLVAVLDAGFDKVNTLSAFSEMDIAGTYDFVNREESVYEDHSHGRNVLSALGGYAPGSLVGGAYKASFYLFRTEDVFSESPLEEVYWIIGAERADSLGVDVINTSLGYIDFDDPKYDYKHEDLDGKTALISKGANWAAETGMLLVIAAGNAGDSDWEKISTPADSEKVLTIGAVNENKTRAFFSSIGYNANGVVKPDVMAQGQNTVVWSGSDVATTGSGTSYAAPVFCGMAVGFWQKNPTLTNFQVMRALQRSGDNYDNPTPQNGYGIPHFEAAQEYADVITALEDEPIENNITVYPNPFSSGKLHIRFSFQQLGKEVKIRVSDITGKEIFHQNQQITNTTLELDFNQQLSKGLYLITILGEKERKVLKFVKI